MLEPTRRRRIEELVRARGECSVRALAQECGVSHMTVRRDLQTLAEGGRILRTHGGAAPLDQVMFEFQFLKRARVQEAAKRQIALQAAKLVEDGQTVMLDSGTTTLALAKELRACQRLTVVTTSLPIASALQFAPGVQVLLLGGYLRRGSPDLGGALTEANLEGLRVSLAFVGADGLDVRGNLYNHSLENGRLLSKVRAIAQRVYVLADSSKIGAQALTRFGNVARWDGLITDAGIKPAQMSALKNAGVRLIVSHADGLSKRDGHGPL